MSVARNLGRIGRQSAVYGLGSIAANLLAVFLLPLYTHQIDDAAEFGDAELALRLVLAVAIVARLGLVAAFFRFFFDHADDAQRRTTFRTVFWTLQGTTLVWAAATAGTAHWLGPRVFATEPIAERLVLLVALGVYVSVNYELTSALFRVQQRPVAYSVRTVVNLLSTAAFSILFLVVLDMGADGLLLGAYLGQLLVYAFVLVEQRSWLGLSLDRPLLRRMLDFGLPLMPAGAALWAVTLINRPVVRAVDGAAALGVLGAAFRIGTGVMLLVNAFQLAWPAFAYSLKDDGEARRTYAAVMTIYLAAMGWAAATLALLAPWLVRLLTAEQYWDAKDAVLPIALAGPLYGGYFICAVGVGRMKRNRFNWVIVGLAAVVEVVALLALVPPFGVAGAGWAMVLAYGTMFVGMAWKEHQIFPVPYPWWRIARVPAVLAAALVGGAALPDDGAVALAARLGIAAAIPVALLLGGVASRGELAAMRGAIAGGLRRGGAAPAESGAEG